MDLAENIAALNQRFAVEGAARIVAGNNGLPKVVVSSYAAAGAMYLHGAQVVSWIPKGSGEALYVSPNSAWQEGRAIRGGVPISFPWFANKADDPAAPAHGFVRTRSWQLESIQAENQGITVSMSTESTDETQKLWPFRFRINCRATFGQRLKVELIVFNAGSSPFVFEEALHAYFRVGDVEDASVRGLDGTEFLDKTDQYKKERQNGDLRLSSETDRVYLNTVHDVELRDPILKRRTILHKQNSLTTVIWNPWAEKSRSMSDLGADGWKNFVCLETSNVDAFAAKLEPGEKHGVAMVLETALL